MARINLAFCIHSHQPTGNFPWVFRNAYDRAYRPFLEVVRRHPHIKVVLHYSGSLLTWLEENRPEIFDNISYLVRQGRAEMLTGGFYEPILAIIPERDTLGQITYLTEYLKRHFDADPKGLWLTERVWQPDLVAPLRRADVRYTIVDDNNFRQTGISEEDSLGRFLVRGENGQTLDIFPINGVLRRAIPFQPPEASIDYLRRVADDGDKLAVFADDGEKFGEWPGTHDLVYRQGWLDRFFGLLGDNHDWIRVITLREALESMPARATIELPAGSYEEMMEWSGGSWLNFLRRYPEANLLYRKMQRVSAQVARANLEEEAAREARDLLYRGEANDAYWHGVFGGLYLTHLRLNNYRNLIGAQNKAAGGDALRVEQTDFDGDGEREVVVESKHLNAYIHRVGGQLLELDHRGVAANLLATLTRRREPYHDRLGETEEGRRLLPLHYDWYPRRALIDHFLRDDVNLEAFSNCEYGEQGDFVNQPYEMDVTEKRGGATVTLRRRGGVWVGDKFLPLVVTKELDFSRADAEIAVRYQLEQPGKTAMPLWFACESNLVLSDGAGPGRYFRVGAEGEPLSLETRAAYSEVTEFTLADDERGGGVSLRFERPTAVWTFPVKTVSRGLERPSRSYQGTSITGHWRLTLEPGQVWTTSFVIALRSSEGRAGAP